VSRTNPRFPIQRDESSTDVEAATTARNVRALARFLDSSIAIPGTNFRFGFDAVVGLVPVVGDVIGGVLSGYIIVQAARARVPVLTLARMLGNIGIDTVVGAVPALGDVFDVAWKANMKNVALLERHMAVALPPVGERKGVIKETLLALVVIAAIVGAGLVLSVFLVQLLWGLLTR
jgi:hypothetical protein